MRLILIALLLPLTALAQPVVMLPAPGYTTTKDEGTPLTKRRSLNFAGAGVSCVDNAGTATTDCTIAGGGGGPAPSLLTYVDVAALPAAASNSGAFAYVQLDGSYYYSDGVTWYRVAYAGFLGYEYSLTGTAKEPFFRVDASGGNVTVTIPADELVGQGMIFFRADSSGNTVTIAPASGTIDGAASITLVPQEARIVSSNGSNVWKTQMQGRADGAAIGLRETSGPAVLAMAAVADTELLARSGTTIDGIAIGTGAGTVAAGNDSRFTDSRAPNGAASGDLGGTYPSPTVTQARGLRETAGPTTLTMGAVADGEYLVRSGTTIVGGSGGSGAPSTATYITQVADAGLSNEQALGALATGILKSTTTTGVVSIAAAGVDYQAAGTYLSSVEDEGTPLTQRTAINFAGAGVTCVDSGGTKTLCTIPGGSGSGLDLQQVQIATIYGGL